MLSLCCFIYSLIHRSCYFNVFLLPSQSFKLLGALQILCFEFYVNFMALIVEAWAVLKRVVSGVWTARVVWIVNVRQGGR